MPMFAPSPNAIRGAAAALTVATATIVAWEGYEPVARHDPIDPPGVITVCNGITNYDLPGLKKGDKFTKDECFNLLKEHLPRYTNAVDKCVKVAASNYTKAALYSAAYNLGPGAVCKSSMVRKINAGDLQGGCDALLLYTHANGKFVQGLLNRRKAERVLCLQKDPAPAPEPEAPIVVAQPAPPPEVMPAPAPEPVKVTKPTFWQRVKGWFGW